MAHRRPAPPVGRRGSPHPAGAAAGSDEAPRRLPKIGQGRAAQVFSDRDAAGRPIARKVFTGDAASKLVLYLLTGAPNPYAWCEPAIRAAVARRRILTRLVAYWFGGRLRLPRTAGWRWNREHRAHELAAELVDGRHLPLRGPRDDHSDDPLRDLVDGVMKPLQRHLADAGLDGLVWQAGLGNPVAAGNFMLDGGPGTEGGAPGETGRRWVWIDLESGVPALFAMNPLATLRFYLPRSLHHRRWLFDDVDVPGLERYLERHREGLEQALGAAAVDETVAAIAELDRHQRAWKSMPRLDRSIAYERSQDRITDDEAERYRTRPLAWYARLASAGSARLARRLAAAVRDALAWLGAFPYRRAARAVWRFGTSQRYRARAARRLVLVRLWSWERRRFLGRADVRRLHFQLRHGEAGTYVTDFGVHLAMKPFIKALQWFGLPPMLALGMIDLATAGFVLIAGGLIGRVAYTSGRLAQAFVQGHRRPWVAFVVSFLPVVGNAAYPAELLYCSASGHAREAEAARFILYDTLAVSGRALPVWGGKDSLVEHWFNRLGDLAVHWLATPITRAEKSWHG